MLPSPLPGQTEERHLQPMACRGLESWAMRGTVFVFPIRKKESSRQQVGRVVGFSASLTKTKQVSRKEEFITPSLRVAGSAEFISKVSTQAAELLLFIK